MKVINFNDYCKILENNGSGSVNDYNLGYDTSTTGMLNIKNNVKILSNIKRMLNINNIFNNRNVDSYDISKYLTRYSVLRIQKKGDIYVAFIEFDYDGVTFWGRIENILSNNPQFISELFENLKTNRETYIKITHTMLKIFNNWFKAKKGEYRVLCDEVFLIHKVTGINHKISKGQIFDVVRIFDNEITIRIFNEEYILRGDYYVYFNYWFEKI